VQAVPGVKRDFIALLQAGGSNCEHPSSGHTGSHVLAVC